MHSSAITPRETWMSKVHGGLWNLPAVIPLIMIAALATACGDLGEREIVGPDHGAAPILLIAGDPLSKDSIYWDNNQLEYVDDKGDTIRWERDQEQATQVDLFENGVLFATIELSYAGDSLSHARFVAPGGSEWFEATSDGTITQTVLGPGRGMRAFPPEPRMPRTRVHATRLRM